MCFGDSSIEPKIPRRQARPQGGSDDLDRLVALCPSCHVRTDAPYVCGGLLVTALGAGRFIFEVTRGADKYN